MIFFLLYNNIIIYFLFVWCSITIVYNILYIMFCEAYNDNAIRYTLNCCNDVVSNTIQIGTYQNNTKIQLMYFELFTKQQRLSQ